MSVLSCLSMAGASQSIAPRPGRRALLLGSRRVRFGLGVGLDGIGCYLELALKAEAESGAALGVQGEVGLGGAGPE